MNPRHMLSLCPATLNYTLDSTTYQITFSLGTVSKSDNVSEADLKLWPQSSDRESWHCSGKGLAEPRRTLTAAPPLLAVHYIAIPISLDATLNVRGIAWWDIGL